MTKERKKSGAKTKGAAQKKEDSLTEVRQRRTFVVDGVVFKETKVFTKKIYEFLDEEEYSDLQDALRIQPDMGDVIPGTGGCRKLRWLAEGKGKRGGARIIYYLYQNDGEIFMLLVYKKSEQANLTMDQKKKLHKMIKGKSK